MPTSVLVFKTNINSLIQLKKLGQVLKSKKGIQKWNIDLEDKDRVLRIETDRFTEPHVVNLLKPHSIYCEDLN